MPHVVQDYTYHSAPPPRVAGGVELAEASESGRVPAHRIKVRVGGMARWNQVVVDLLRSVGIHAFVTRDLSHAWAPRRWAATLGEMRKLSIEHVIFPGPPQRMERYARLLGVQVVYHFIGSDVLALQRLPEPARRERLAQLRRYAAAFVADGPDLQAELAELGLQADILRCIPLGLLGEVSPLPPQFTVLSYWGARPDFYRAPLVLQLAAELRDVPFIIVGTDGRGMNATPNVRFLGEVRDMDAIYRQCSVLLRLPLHDGLPKMVLEAQARGRRVVCSRRLPHTSFAEDFDAAIAALREMQQATEPDHQAAAYVRSEFDPAREARRALELYQRLLA